MESIYPELALCGSKNECGRTETVFFPISQVCTRGVTLTKIAKKERRKKVGYGLTWLEIDENG